MALPLAAGLTLRELGISWIAARSVGSLAILAISGERSSAPLRDLCNRTNRGIADGEV